VVQQFRTICDTDPDSVAAQFQLAEAQLNHGNILNDLQRYPDALAAFEAAEQTIAAVRTRSAPTPQMTALLASTFNNRGDVHRTLKNFTESDAAYRESMRLLEELITGDEINPQYKVGLLRTIRQLAELYRRFDRLADVADQLARGMEVGEQLVQDFPHMAQYHKRLMDIVGYQVVVQLEQGDLRAAGTLAGRALELADSIVALAPDDPQYKDLPLQAVNNIMAVAQKANDLPAQHRALTRLIELDPENADLHRARTEVCLALGRYDDALADLNRLAELTADDAMAALVRAQVLVLADRIEAYRQACGEILERFGPSQDPEVACHAVRACVLAPQAVPDPRVPVELAREAVARDPREWTLYTLGMAHLRAGQLDQAAERFQRITGDRARMECAFPQLARLGPGPPRARRDGTKSNVA
jgi:tetratricopeptide (TPR) repeat protein